MRRSYCQACKTPTHVVVRFDTMQVLSYACEPCASDYARRCTLAGCGVELLTLAEHDGEGEEPVEVRRP